MKSRKIKINIAVHSFKIKSKSLA